MAQAPPSAGAHAPAEGLAEHADGAKGVRDGREEGRADGRGHRRGHLFLLRGARGDGAHALERGGEVRLRGDPDADRAVRASASSNQGRSRRIVLASYG